MNEHWVSYEKLTQPCKYKYDYILKLEDITAESDWLLQSYNVTLHYPKGYHHETNHKRLVDEIIEGIDRQTLRDLFYKLQNDYKLFNYQIPDFFLNKITFRRQKQSFFNAK